MVKLATEYNDSAAQYILARRYLLGKTVKIDLPQAVKWFKLAANNGHSKAQFELGSLYLQGQGVKKDQFKALDWFGKAAKQKNSDALYELGNMFFRGLNGNPDFSRAAKWYTLAAKLNHGKAQYKIGMMYKQGKGVAINAKSSEYWLGLAKEQGIKLSGLDSQPSGQTDSLSTEPTTSSLLPSNYGEHDSTDESNEQGSISKANLHRAESQYKLGDRLLKSARSKDDFKKAVSLFYKAADRGYPMAYYQLGMVYKEGIGVVKSFNEAQKWFKKAQKNGISKAEFELQKIQDQHRSTLTASTQENNSELKPIIGLPVDLIDSTPVQLIKPKDESTNNIQVMAERNDPKAQYQLAISYENGNSVPKDGQKALYWYARSGEQGYLASQLELGKIYMHGRGVEKDLAKSKKWLTVAAQQDSKEAQLLLETLKPQTPLVAMTSKSNDDTSSLNNDKTNDAKEISPKGDFTLAMSYLNGENSAKDTEKAIKLLSKVARENHQEALLILGNIFYQGQDVEQDYGKAVKWYKKAANQGNAEAQFTLGDMYKKGLGVDKNNSLALKWYHKAARQGHTRAKEKLGGCSYC